MKFEEFEKTIITDIIEQYPEYKQNYNHSLRKISYPKKAFSTYGFSTYYIVNAEAETLGSGEKLQLGKHQWNINGLSHGSDYALWIKDSNGLPYVNGFNIYVSNGYCRVTGDDVSHSFRFGS